MKGVSEIETIFEYCNNIPHLSQLIQLDFTLARGLNYYTGTIIEVKANNVEIGSICGGGRYDDLTGIFGLPNISGVGISFGADRIYDVLQATNGFPQESAGSTKILFINTSKEVEAYCLPILFQIRRENINAEIFPDVVKDKKQFKYVDNKKIPFVAIADEEDILNKTITIKDVRSGEKQKYSISNIIEIIRFLNKNN